eukprot:4530936-Pyramimonas_sp.AAC.1
MPPSLLRIEHVNGNGAAGFPRGCQNLSALNPVRGELLGSDAEVAHATLSFVAGELTIRKDQMASKPINPTSVEQNLRLVIPICHDKPRVRERLGECTEGDEHLI